MPTKNLVLRISFAVATSSAVKSVELVPSFCKRPRVTALVTNLSVYR